MYIEDLHLVKFIHSLDLMSKVDLENALEESKNKNKTFSETLLSYGKITKDTLRKVHAHVLGIPFFNLKDKKIPFETLSLIPEPISRNHNIVAFRQEDNTVEVALLDIADLEVIDFLRKDKKLKILPRFTDTESIKSAIIQYQRGLMVKFGDNVQRDLKVFLKHALLQNASNIHIDPTENHLIIRYRIQGVLHDAMILPKNANLPFIADTKYFSGDNKFKKIEIDGEKISIRVLITPTLHGEKISIRILPENTYGFTLEYLGFHEGEIEKIHNALAFQKGMIVVTGPRKSGKTTTLYTLLDILNNPHISISTIENPIELQMKRINQTQIEPKSGLTFPVALRSILRQDPDIVMIGELHDEETASLANNAILTGRLILAGLYANSLEESISKLKNISVKPSLIIAHRSPGVHDIL